MDINLGTLVWGVLLGGSGLVLLLLLKDILTWTVKTIEGFRRLDAGGSRSVRPARIVDHVSHRDIARLRSTRR